MRTTIATLTAALLVLLALPVGSTGQTQLPTDLVKGPTDLVSGLGDAVGRALPVLAPVTSGERPPQATPSSPGGYQAPLHGSAPHAQGSVAVVDTGPSATRPLPGTPSGGFPQAQDSEEVVIGRSRGEVDAAGNYHGHVTILALLGSELLGVDSGEGQLATSLAQPLRDVLLAVCQGSSSQICVDILRVESATTETGSTNRFGLASASLLGLIGLGAAESEGSISDDGNCQIAHGGSSVASTSLGGQPLANAMASSTDSRSCNDGSGSQSSSSSVVELLGAGVALPVPGCANGTPDSVFSIPLIADTVCNADDQNGQGESVAQAPLRYGAREALSAFAVNFGENSLLKSTTSGSEARSEPPAGRTAGDPSAGGAGGELPDEVDTRGEARTRRDVDTRDDARRRRAADGTPGQREPTDPVPDARAAEPRPSDGTLPFTGTDLIALFLIGTLALAVGIPLRAALRRREPRTSPP